MQNDNTAKYNQVRSQAIISGYENQRNAGNNESVILAADLAVAEARNKDLEAEVAALREELQKAKESAAASSAS